jgi:TolB-like protein
MSVPKTTSFVQGPACRRHHLPLFASFFLCAAAFLCVAQEAPALKPTLAILDLDAQGVSRVEAGAVSDALRNAMAELKEYTVVERGQMQEILKEQGFQQTGCTSSECAVEAGKLLGARYLVVGGVGKLGETYVLNVRVVDVQTGVVVRVSSEKIRGKIDDILTMAIPVVAAKLCGYDAKRLEQFVKEHGYRNLFVAGPSKQVRTLRASFFIGGVVLAGGAIASALYANSSYNSYRAEVDPRRTEQFRKATVGGDVTSYICTGLAAVLLIGGGITFAF